MAKVLEEDERRGTKVYRYRKLGPDHYRHATNYFELAVRDLPTTPILSDRERMLLEIQEKQQSAYNPLTYGLRVPGSYDPTGFGFGEGRG
jgi:hypothetical protein